jgi:hypothetical protein
VPKDRDYKNLIKSCVFNWISRIDGAKEGAAGLDNSVEARKEDFNYFMRLRIKTISTGSGEKDKFVEVLQNNFFKGLCIKASFGPAHLQSPVPDTFLNFPACQALALVASRGLKLEFDAFADIHPEIWRFAPE